VTVTASGQQQIDAALTDYVAAEDALRAFTDRNFGRLCATCARWTLLSAKVNSERDAQLGPLVGWRLGSWVTNCCNANHALESMDEDSLAGIVASRAEGREWWNRVKRAHAAPCGALTETGCALQKGRPELCNRYFCEAVRDYLWELGGERRGTLLAERLDDVQRRWTKLYETYQRAVRDARDEVRAMEPKRVRRDAGVADFLALLERFDREIASCARPVPASLLTNKLFKVSGEKAVYEPFFEAEVAAVGGEIRRSD
jgi:hypothetical protein